VTGDSSINFILAEMTHLRYFCPLIEAANRIGAGSIVFVRKSGKYNCPVTIPRNKSLLEAYSSKLSFELRPIDQFTTNTDLTFLVEGVGTKFVKLPGSTVSLTYMSDFTHLFDGYKDHVCNTVFMSPIFASTYDKEHPNNLYLSSPKYDIVDRLTKNALQVKAELLPGVTDKTVLIFAPRLRDVGKIDLKKLYSDLKMCGITVLFKTRNKDSFRAIRDRVCDHYFEDEEWYPHTSMSLVAACDFVINFSSTAVEECVAFRKPLINFHIKPFEKHFPFLYSHSYCHQMSPAYSFDELKDSIEYMLEESHKQSFLQCWADNELDFPRNSSELLLGRFLGT